MNSKVVMTSCRLTMMLLALDTVSVVVRPGKSTAVSIPSTVTWVCSVGIVTVVVASPVKAKTFLSGGEGQR